MPRRRPYTVAELAKLKGCSQRTVTRAIARGDLLAGLTDGRLVISANAAGRWTPRPVGAPKGSGALPPEQRRTEVIKTVATVAEKARFLAKVRKGESAQAAARRILCGKET